jgi:hypothetical protein
VCARGAQRQKVAGFITSDLSPEMLPTLDTLRNFFLPTAERLIVVQMMRDCRVVEIRDLTLGFMKHPYDCFTSHKYSHLLTKTANGLHCWYPRIPSSIRIALMIV